MIKSGPSPLRKWVIPALILLATGTLFYVGYRMRDKWKREHVLLELKPVEVPGGWGYLILMNDHVYIKQYEVPAIGGSHPFPSREAALEVGQKVYDRLVAGQTPIVTEAEVKAMGILPAAVLQKDSLASVQRADSLQRLHVGQGARP
jgi:uncharacterized protein DUF4907